MATGAAVLAGVLVVVVGALWLLQRQLIYLPDRRDPGPAAARVDGARDVSFPTADGLTLRAWYLPATGSCDTTVLVAPGNAGHRAGRLPLARGLSGAGLGVLLIDYRGYGGNPGRATGPGLVADVRAARAFLDRELEPGARVIYFGESLGAAPVARLAGEVPPAGLLLRSPFVDLAAAAAHHYPVLPVRWMLWDDLPVRDLVAALDVPVTVLAGSGDRVIPHEQSVAVAAAAQARMITVPGADHNDPALAYGPMVLDAVRQLAGPECG